MAAGVAASEAEVMSTLNAGRGVHMKSRQDAYKGRMPKDGRGE